MPPVRIANHIAFESYWGTGLPPNILDLDDGPTVGGGEEAGLRCGAGLVALGHDVTTWWYGRSGTWRGMEMKSLHDSFYPEIVSTEWDAVVSWSGLKALEWAQRRKDGKYPRRLFAQQLNSLWERGDWSKVDCIISPSAHHAEQLDGWGWKKRPHAVVHNGLDPEKYVNIPSWSSRPLDVGYWSSPDRGLHHLLAAWPLVVAVEPRAKLHVFYEIDRYLKGGVGGAGLYGDRARTIAKLVPQAKLDSSVIFHGAVPRNKLAPIQMQCRVMCYPYDTIQYCEGFCHPAGTYITTIGGMKPVDQLTLRDQVLGRSGKWRSVTALRSRKYEGKLVRISPNGGQAIEFTDDHPILAADTEIAEYHWVQAGKIKPGMWLYSVGRQAVSRWESGQARKLKDGAAALKVREVDERPFSGMVYSLSVDVDESYHTGNFVVHNCGSMNQGIAAGCLVMATPKDALLSLYGNTAYWMLDEGESAQTHRDYFKWLAKRIVEALRCELPDQMESSREQLWRQTSTPGLVRPGRWRRSAKAKAGRRRDAPRSLRLE